MTTHRCSSMLMDRFEKIIFFNYLNSHFLWFDCCHRMDSYTIHVAHPICILCHRFFKTSQKNCVFFGIPFFLKKCIFFKKRGNCQKNMEFLYSLLPYGNREYRIYHFFQKNAFFSKKLGIHKKVVKTWNHKNFMVCQLFLRIVNFL